MGGEWENTGGAVTIDLVMAYTVLARRYRSTSFEEVVGQEPIAKTLRNAITTGRVAHAYLFTGTRGVGKTSMARLFARALNAPDTVSDAPKLPDAEYPEQDVQGRMAEAIMRGDDLNVIEIDGASNNKVEDARDLIANAGLAPTANALFKIYIIDEVHMLSISAFNALLKTMEEPPEHVKFILCTTEAHKVPATIQSRCQRFDFRNIATPRIAEHLKAVLAKEEVESADEVIWQLARLGNGSMRDALSLLDRLIATGDRPLTEQTIEQMLGLPPQDLVVGLIDAMAVGDAGTALQRTSELLSRGIAQDQLLEVLIERLRQLMLIRSVGVDSELVELSNDAADQAAKQAEQFDVPALVHMIALCESLGRYGKSSSTPRALLDAGIVRLALAEKMADVSALLSGRVGPASTSGSKKKVTPAPSPAPLTRNAPHVRPAIPGVEANRGKRADHDAAHRSTASANNGEAQTLAPLPITGHVPDIWQRVLELIRQRPSMSWVKQLRLTEIDQANAVAKLQQPGRLNVARFISERQHEQLAELFSQVFGKRVRVEIAASTGGGGDANDGNDRGNGNGNGGAVNLADRNASRTNGSSGQGTPDSPIDRRALLSMPLVKMVADRFSVTLVDARPEPTINNTVVDQTSEQNSRQTTGHSATDPQATGQPPLIARAFEAADNNDVLMDAELDEDDDD